MPTYGLADLDGDGAPELIVLDICNNQTIGETAWRVYPNTGAGFGASTDLPIPGVAFDDTQSFDDLSNVLDCQNDLEPSYLLQDLNGDGLPDLVVTDECDTGTGPSGETIWKVYFGTGAGFPGAEVAWTIPGVDYAGEETFDLSTEPQNCQGIDDKPTYYLSDLDGDGLPELVITDTCDGNSPVGEDYWLYYANTGTGFASSPTRWAVPGASFQGSETFDEFSSDGNCGRGVSEPAYELVDLDGDGAQEIVLVNLCNDARTGETIWGVVFPTCPVGLP